ncbi:hypothetical protein BC939DRAFT_480699 [Gamsiella multidivaricata]|uniref:uncharacterized protein n=1 Tax=Gamsiella multidivaricata TaxID=101098 RepID=UPI00222111AD|nr:uncharacterized protein BC939DRAFT_480699 [Gamsiella multidivaricata]KAI7818041.1 hypothetical protein BC939DRAFT_480699 [Gamsiella multidivaricata]
MLPLLSFSLHSLPDIVSLDPSTSFFVVNGWPYPTQKYPLAQMENEATFARVLLDKEHQRLGNIRPSNAPHLGVKGERELAARILALSWTHAKGRVRNEFKVVVERVARSGRDQEVAQEERGGGNGELRKNQRELGLSSRSGSRLGRAQRDDI